MGSGLSLTLAVCMWDLHSKSSRWEVWDGKAKREGVVTRWFLFAKLANKQYLIWGFALWQGKKKEPTTSKWWNLKLQLMILSDNNVMLIKVLPSIIQLWDDVWGWHFRWCFSSIQKCYILPRTWSLCSENVFSSLCYCCRIHQLGYSYRWI